MAYADDPRYRFVTESALADALAGFDSFVGIPIFATLAEAEAWEAANPGKKALTLEPSTPDTTAPTAGILTVTPAHTSAVLSVSGASDDRAVTEYAFKVGTGAWSAWQAGSTFTATGLTASTPYSFQHKVRDRAGNEAVGVAVQGTTSATPPPAAKTPAEIGSLWGHWDASVAGSLSLSGENVTAWAGVTANARTAVQANAAQQPVTSTINSKTAVKFNREASQYLRHQSSFSIDATVGYTAVAIVRWDDSDYAAAQSAFSFNSGGGIKRRSPDGLLISNTPTAGGPDSAKPTAGQVHIVAVRAQNGVATVWAAGAGKTTTAATPNPSTALDFGRFAGGQSDYGNVTIAEMWTHERALTDDELASLRQYAQQKWGAL